MANAIFMKFEGENIEGECREAGHIGWLQVEGVGHGLTANIDRMATSGSGTRNVGATEHSDFSFSKQIDKSSVPLYAKCCAGQSFDLVKVDFMSSLSGQEGAPSVPILQLEMTNTLIAGVSYSDDLGGRGRVLENWALNYEQIKWIYTPYDDAGNSLGAIEKYWNIKDQTGG